MGKLLTYASLADLLADYVASYARWWHTVLRIRIGLPVPHDAMHEGMVCSCDSLLHLSEGVKLTEIHHLASFEIWTTDISDLRLCLSVLLCCSRWVTWTSIKRKYDCTMA